MQPSKSTSNKKDVLEQARRAREERAAARERQELAAQRVAAVVILQKNVRRFLACRLARRQRLTIFDHLIAAASDDAPARPRAGSQPSALEIQTAVHHFLQATPGSTTNVDAGARLQRLCYTILQSATASVPRSSNYFSLATQRETAPAWLSQVQALAQLLIVAWEASISRRKEDVEAVTLYVQTLLLLSSHTAWKLEAGDPTAQQALNAALNIFSASVANKIASHLCNLSTATLLVLRVIHTTNKHVHALPVLLVPGWTRHVRACVPPVWPLADKQQFVARILPHLSQEEHFNSLITTWSANDALFVLGNLADGLLDEEVDAQVPLADVMEVCQRLLVHCASFAKSAHGATSTEHPLLGWTSCHTSRALLDCMPTVLQQLQPLWQRRAIRATFQSVWTETDRLVRQGEGSGTSKRSGGLLRFFTGRPDPSQFVTSAAAMHVRHASEFYDILCTSLHAARVEIIASLAFVPELVPRLWTFMDHIGPKGGMAVFVDALPELEKEPLLPILSLTTMLTSHLLLVLDDLEIFEQEDPFRPDQLLKIARCLHVFVFRALWEAPDPQAPASATGSSSSTSTAVKSPDNVPRTNRAARQQQALLRQRRELRDATSALLRRICDIDSRRPFIPLDHWKIRGVPSATIVKRLHAERSAHPAPAYRPASNVLAHLPHILGFHER
ncbi:uncharacterized protein MONBRDRAFT_33825, partial [Monosiga brevicollis MX1]